VAKPWDDHEEPRGARRDAGKYGNTDEQPGTLRFRRGSVVSWHEQARAAICRGAHENDDRYDKTIDPVVACLEVSGCEREKGNREDSVKRCCRGERHDAADKMCADAI